MTRAISSSTRWLVAWLLVCTAAACEDRSPSEDLERTRTGGIEHVPEFGSSAIPSGGVAGVSGGVNAGAQGAGIGGAGSGGLGGTGGVAGIGGAGGFGGAAVDVDGDGRRDDIGASTGIGVGAGTDVGMSGTGAIATGAGTVGIVGVGADGFGGIDDDGFDGIAVDGPNNRPSASFIITPQCVSEIQTDVTLTSTSSDPDGDALRCTWTLPTGVPADSSDCSVTATFFEVTESQVSLTVEDGNGGTDITTLDLAVCDPGAAPAPEPFAP